MGAETKIEWADSTVNPWSGCSMGCGYCYARRIAIRIHGGTYGARAKFVWRESAIKLGEQINIRPFICDVCGAANDDRRTRGGLLYCWKCECTRPYHRRRVFFSMGDWLDHVDPLWTGRFLDLVRRCDQVNWLLLTKRPEAFADRMRAVRELWACDGSIHETNEQKTYHWICQWSGVDLPANRHYPNDGLPEHVWVGTSCENQAAADRRIPELLRIPALARFVSFEPLMGPVDARAYMTWRADVQKHGLQSPLREAIESLTDVPGIDWAIIGGASGPDAPACNIEWIRKLRDQARADGVPVFVKQLGSCAVQDLSAQLPPADITDESIDAADVGAWEHHRHNCPMFLKDRNGGDPAEWPVDLRVRERPPL